MAGTNFSDSSKAAFYIALRLAPASTVNLIHAIDFPDTSIRDKISQYSGDFIEDIGTKQLEEFALVSKK